MIQCLQITSHLISCYPSLLIELKLYWPLATTSFLAQVFTYALLGPGTLFFSLVLDFSGFFTSIKSRRKYNLLALLGYLKYYFLILFLSFIAFTLCMYFIYLHICFFICLFCFVKYKLQETWILFPHCCSS